MILQRKTGMNIADIKAQYAEMFGDAEAAEPISELLKFLEAQQLYNAAMQEVSTKLEILDDEFQMRHERNPIHHLECRLKSTKSLLEKLQRRSIPLTMDSIRDNIHDIAGIRVICNYVEDIYVIAQLLLKQADITLIEEQDYIKNPKPNGYRSLHLVLSVPVFLAEGTETVPVEIQLRTTAMDFWASLEHQLRYKNSSPEVEQHKHQLKACADKLAEIEAEMQSIYQQVR